MDKNSHKHESGVFANSKSWQKQVRQEAVNEAVALLQDIKQQYSGLFISHQVRINNYINKYSNEQQTVKTN